jgi:hypothetical protein
MLPLSYGNGDGDGGLEGNSEEGAWVWPWLSHICKVFCKSGSRCYPHPTIPLVEWFVSKHLLGIYVEPETHKGGLILWRLHSTPSSSYSNVILVSDPPNLARSMCLLKSLKQETMR